MIKNYFKIAWRNAYRNKTQSLINLLGLTIGLTCVVLIALYIRSELQYDKQFSNADRIFRVNMSGKMGEEAFYAGYTPPPAGRALMDNFPEIESYARIYRPGAKVVRAASPSSQEKFFTEDRILSVDSNFLQLLDYPLSQGDRNTCLMNSHSIVISNTMAQKYFGNTNPIGKTLAIEGDHNPYLVTAILADNKTPTSLRFDFLLPIANEKDVKYFDWSWVWLNVATYVKFKPHIPHNIAAIQHLESKFPMMMRQQAASAFDRIGQPYDQFLKKGGKWDLHLQPLTAIHLHSADIVSTVTDQGNIKYVYFFSIIAFFILLLACVNFMNLSTANASRRAKEIGVRKVVGSTKRQLTKQFYIEALLLSILACILALAFVYFIIPYFNQLADKTIVFSSLWLDGNWIYLLLIVVLCALLAGSYPAFYLSSLAPISILKGTKSPLKHQGMRSGLIVFQFSVSTALAICSLIVYQQLRYTQIHDLGLDQENVLVLPNSKRLGNSEESFKEELKKSSHVIDASISTNIPGRGAFGDFYVPLSSNGDQPIAKDITLSSYLTDDNFIKTLNIQLLQGRGFDPGFDNSRTILINETAAKRMGYKNPLGKFIKYPGGNAAESYQIIGIMKDFNTESLHSPIVPFALFHKSSKSYEIPSSFLVIRVKSGDLSPILKEMEHLWKTFSPNTPFEYSFLRDDLAMQYESDQRTGKIIGIFSLLSIVIACIGLLGLVIFATQQRTKEIGIRKVLGASVIDIMQLLSKNFIRLLLVAFLIAAPIAWWVMTRWLDDFAYKITIQWWMFVLAGMAAMFIALLTISIQAVKAATVNPVESLRDE
jgi:putative ABC transport system permease protein